MPSRQRITGRTSSGSTPRAATPARSAGDAAKLVRAGRGRHISPADVMALQSTAGNTAVQRLIASDHESEPLPVQTLSAAGTAGRVIRGGAAVGGWPIARIRQAFARWKGNRQSAADRKVIEDIATAGNYEELRSLPAWRQDRAKISEIEEQITEEAIRQGRTINF